MLSYFFDILWKRSPQHMETNNDNKNAIINNNYNSNVDMDNCDSYAGIIGNNDSHENVAFQNDNVINSTTSKSIQYTKELSTFASFEEAFGSLKQNYFIRTSKGDSVYVACKIHLNCEHKKKISYDKLLKKWYI